MLSVSLINYEGGIMSVKELYFSTSGRINRSTLWLKFWLPAIAISAIASFIDIGLGTYDAESGLGGVGIMASLLMLYPAIAVYVKRAHDRGRSGHFVVLMFVPFVCLWPVVELFFLPGAKEDNEHGSVPT